MPMLRILPIIGLIALLGLACGGESEEPVPSNSETASPATQIPSSGATVPADWQTYSDSEGRFLFRYPPDWFSGRATSVYSKDPSTFTGIGLPPEIVKVEVGHSAALGSTTCGGAQAVDPATGESLGPLPSAIPAALGGINAWRIIRPQGDPILEGGVTRIDGTTVIYGDYCFHIAAYYTQQEPDEETFSRIVDSFTFLY